MSIDQLSRNLCLINHFLSRTPICNFTKICQFSTWCLDTNG